MDVVAKYNLDMSGLKDNYVALAQMRTDILALKKAEKPLPSLQFTEGTCAFTDWPNLAFPGLKIIADGQVILKNIGSGDVIFDGSQLNPIANEPGIDNLQFMGFEIWPAPGRGVVFSGIHRSNLDVKVVPTGTTGQTAVAITMNFCIITEIHPVVGGMHSIPYIGLVLDTWPGKDLQSTACTVNRPCLEGLWRGMQVRDAGSCYTYGGTIENCTVGVEIIKGGHNVWHCVEMEGNQDYDVVATGSGSAYNSFQYCGNDGNLKTSFPWITSNWVKN